MKDLKETGRVSAEFVVANNRDVVRSGLGVPVLDNVKHIIVFGVVDNEAARFVLPKHVADQLQLTVDGDLLRNL